MIILTQFYVKDVMHTSESDFHSFLKVFHNGFLYIFCIEILLKMFAFGLQGWSSDYFYIFDAILVFTSFGISLSSMNSSSMFTLLRTLRLLHILKHFPRMQMLWLFLRSLLRSFGVLFLAQFIIFYVFSMIGMTLFHECISRQTVYEKVVSYDDSHFDGNSTFYWKTVQDSYYFLNNMNSFVSTIIVLLELSVVNNWQIIMDMYIEMTDNAYNRLFFIVFYFCSVIVVLNVMIAFVIELFLLNYKKNYSQNDLLFRYKQYVLQAIEYHAKEEEYEQFNIKQWNIERRLRPVLVYQMLFEDTVAENIAQMQREEQEYIDYEVLALMPFDSNPLLDQYGSEWLNNNVDHIRFQRQC